MHVSRHVTSVLASKRKCFSSTYIYIPVMEEIIVSADLYIATKISLNKNANRVATKISRFIVSV